ncbi:hypothetical protein [Xanthobacter sp. KR7-225]|uniref:hypothetical protein n=1 Tax=Xanthobacter sp. KR7-225 TaxID=3156613 RepID=UPI0032B54DB7
MTSTTPLQNLSTAERRRQLEESTSRAMERYRTDFEAQRAKTSRLRAEREAREASEAATPPKPARGRRAAAWGN